MSKVDFCYEQKFVFTKTSSLTFFEGKQKERETLKFISCYGNLLFFRDTWMKEDGQNWEHVEFSVFSLYYFKRWQRWTRIEDGNP